MKKLLLALTVSLIASPAIVLAATPAKETNAKAVAYKKAKEAMAPDLYVVYRITDRIVTANNLARPIRVAVRRGVGQADAACDVALGANNTPGKCQAYDLLPDVDRATNFDLWAAQVVATMAGNANAAASSDSGAIWINMAMLKEVAGKPDQLACVVGHELAHVTQNHQEEKRKKFNEYSLVAAKKIAAAATNAHNAQKSAQTWSLILAGVSSGLSGNNSAIYQTSNQITLSQIQAAIIAPEIAKEALKYAPDIGDAINTMQGLAPNYAKRTTLDMNNFLRDSTLSLAGFSRKQEYEADLLGLEYVVTAGFDPSSCIKLWEETMPHDKNKLIARLLPKGTKDPALTPTTDQTSIVGEKNKNPEEECRGTNIDCQQARMNKSDDGPDSSSVPSEVMQNLLSSHPEKGDRSTAITNHLATLQKGKLANKGKGALTGQLVRDWSYDKLSESVIIMTNLVSPKQAGDTSGGTTGIDVDKKLGF